MAKFLRSRQLFEIGTFRGYTTYHLALNTASDAHVYTLDLPALGIQTAKLELTDLSLIEKPISGEWFHNTQVQKNISQLFGDSATFDYTPYEGKMDFVYVDGGHSYGTAMSDSLVSRAVD